MHHLRVAVKADSRQIIAIRDQRASWLLERGVHQWLPGEFSVERLDDWVADGRVHVAEAEDGAIAGVVAVLWEDPDVWPADGSDDAGYVHLLVTALDHRGRGLGDELLSHAEHQIGSAGRGLTRLDAVETNESLLAWYERRGYRRVGVRRFEKPEWFDCVLMEKENR